MISKVEINLNTSFRGTDLLTTTLEVGNNGLDTFGATGIGTDGLIAGGAADYSGVGANVELSRLFYSFKPTKDLTIGVVAAILSQ